MQTHTIAKSIRKVAAFTAVAVFLSACVDADLAICGLYPGGCAPRMGPPQPQLTPGEAAIVQAQELFQQAEVHIAKDRYRQAERVIKESIRIYENALGREATPLGPVATLTNLYIQTDRTAEAEKLLLRRPRNRVAVALELFRRAEVYISNCQYQQAERALKESIRFYENALGREATEGPLATLTNLYIQTDRTAEAVKLLLKRPRNRDAVLRGLERVPPSFCLSASEVGAWKEALARFKAQVYSEAEAQYERALQVQEKARGAEHSNLVPVLIDLAELYREQQKYADAETAFLRVLAIREKASGPEHPDVMSTLKDLVNVYLTQSKYDEVEPIYKRLITIKEASLGAEHPDVAEALNTLARFYLAQGRYADAESIYKRQLAMHERASERQGIAESLDQLAQLYEDQGRPAKAEEFRDRAWELSSPYCYRPESNTMSIIAPKWAECPSRAVFASRSEYEEWKASKEAYREKFRQREAAE